MFTVALGHSIDPFSDDAISEVLEATDAELKGAVPQAAILFAGVDHNHQVLLDAIWARYPGIHLVGCTTDGEVSSRHSVTQDSVVLALLASDTIEFSSGVGKKVSENGEVAGRMAVESALAASKLPVKLCIAFPESLATSAGQVIHGLKDALGSEVPIFGGLAGDQLLFRKTAQFYQNKVLQDSVPVLLLNGPVKFQWQSALGWKPVGRDGKVTRARGAIIQEIDGRRAIDFYKEHTGGVETWQAMVANVVANPLMVLIDGTYHLRNVIRFDENSGALVCFADVPEGATVRIGHCLRPTLLAGAREMLERSLADFPHAKFGLYVSCASRRMLLGTQSNRESEGLNVPGAPPFLGFFSYGEFCPEVINGPTQFHNSTLVFLLLGEAAEVSESPATQRDLEKQVILLKRQLSLAERDRERLEYVKDKVDFLMQSIEETRTLILDKNAELDRLNRDLEAARKKSDELLLNVLPPVIADELKAMGRVEPKVYSHATVGFTDFVGFTSLAEQLSPSLLLETLDHCFTAFDAIVTRFGLEKLKTIGDSYMFAGGLPNASHRHAMDCVAAALAMRDFIVSERKRRHSENLPVWEMRLGLNTGTVMAGVIGRKKFSFDIWGDTVNTASRLESSGVAGSVNVSHSTYIATRDVFDYESRGKIGAKRKGELEMYLCLGLKPEFRDKSGEPNEKFWKL